MMSWLGRGPFQKDYNGRLRQEHHFPTTGFGVTLFSEIRVVFPFLFFGSARVSDSVLNSQSGSVEDMVDVTVGSVASYDDLLS